MSKARAFAYRQKALQAYDKAMRAGIPEATRRAWLIVERDWTRMAEQEELKDAMSWVGQRDLHGAHDFRPARVQVEDERQTAVAVVVVVRLQEVTCRHGVTAEVVAHGERDSRHLLEVRP